MSRAESTRTLKIALALGSGSARGLSHIGVIQELAALGIAPDIVCGTSIGALVGGAYACGHIDDLGAWFSRMTTADVFRYLDISPLPRGGSSGTCANGLAVRSSRICPSRSLP